MRCDNDPGSRLLLSIVSTATVQYEVTSARALQPARLRLSTLTAYHHSSRRRPPWRTLIYPTCTTLAPRPCNSPWRTSTCLPPCRTRLRRSLCRPRSPPSRPDNSRRTGQELTSRATRGHAISADTKRPRAIWTASRRASCVHGTTKSAHSSSLRRSAGAQTIAVQRRRDTDRMEAMTRKYMMPARSSMGQWCQMDWKCNRIFYNGKEQCLRHIQCHKWEYLHHRL